MPTLVFIAPLWCSELEELIQITKNSYQIKILTQKQNFNFEDPYVEILQCFETYSPFEITKLLPWMLQLSSPQFHLILPNLASPRQLAGIGTIISIAKALPQSYLTHSPWPIKNWSFSLWLKAFQSLFDNSLSNYGTRILSLPKSAVSDVSLFKITQVNQDNIIDVTSNENVLNNIIYNSNERMVSLYQSLWIFPTQNLIEKEWQLLIHTLLRRNDNLIELWNWNELPTRKKNKIRQQFYFSWNQFQLRSPRLDFGDWSQVKFLVLTENSHITMSEKDLLDLTLIHRINIVMDEAVRCQLKGPWLDGDSFWLWHPSQIENDNRPWSNPHSLLPFTTINELGTFRDHLSNEILRSLSR